MKTYVKWQQSESVAALYNYVIVLCVVCTMCHAECVCVSFGVGLDIGTTGYIVCVCVCVCVLTQCAGCAS